MARQHVLIVDDEPRVAFFLGKSLEHSQQDCRITTARSGEEALEILNRSQVDLLVTDLRMPGISGLELLRWVRASSPETRTILITAYGNDEVEAEAQRLEAYRYITKPFNVQDFAQTVHEALHGEPLSQPGLVVLSDESFEAIIQQLEELRREVGAGCIFLADMLGQCLVEVGVTRGLERATLLSLLAGGFATTSELARHFDSPQAINLNFHEGAEFEIYSANVGEDLFLAMLFDRKGKASRIGLVWLYTRRTIARLLSIVKDSAASTALPQELDADFGASLMTELDTLFPGSGEQKSEQAPTPPRSQPPTSRPRPADPAPAPEETVAATQPDREPALGMAETPNTPPTAPSRSESSPTEQATEWSSALDVEPVRFEAESEKELLDIETAIARGIIPADLGRGPRREDS